MRLSKQIVGSLMDQCLLLCSLIAIGGLWWSVQQRLLDGPAMVYIYHGKVLLAHYPLQAPLPITFQAKGSIGVSIVRIADGQVSFTAAPCRSQRCVLDGQRHHIHDLLACVPNRILVVIQGGGQGERLPDAIAQ